MFTIDTDITDLKVKERNLYRVLFSMNIHQVATPELSAEDAKSYVFFFGEGGRYSAYVGLHFLASDRKMYYRHSSNPFPENEFSNVENEARSFAEDMGAMLDELPLAKMSDVEKDRWIEEQDIFSSAEKAEEPAVEPAADADVAQGQNAPASAAVTPPADVQPAAATAVEPSSPVQPSPVLPPPPLSEKPSATAGPTSAEPIAAERAEVRTADRSAAPPRTQRKQAAPSRPPADIQKSPVPAEETSTPAEDVLHQAVEAGIVKAPKQPAKKNVRGSSGVVSRDREALARLLASF